MGTWMETGPPIRSLTLAATACLLVMARIAVAVESPPAVLPVCSTSSGPGGAQLVNLDAAGNVGFVFVSRSAEIEADSDDDLLASVVLRMSVRLLDATGARLWQYSYLTVTTGELVSADASIDDVVPATSAGVATRLARYYPDSLVCEGLGVVEAGGQRYLFVASGVGGVDGDSGTADATIVKIWLLDLATGALVSTHRIRGGSGGLILLSDSAVFDVDNDGDDELTVVRSVYLNEVDGRSRFRLMFDAYSLLTAEPEQSFTTIVSDAFVNENAILQQRH